MLSLEEVSKHRSDDDCWLIVGADVYNVSEFLDAHPGGRQAIMAFAGKDATAAFRRHHSTDILKEHGPAMMVGSLARTTKIETTPSCAKALRSPFPHAKFEGTGLEAVRFQWANLEALVAAPDASDIHSGTIFRHKNNLAPLDESDWLHVHNNIKYPEEMRWRHTLLTQHAHEVCTSAKPVSLDSSGQALPRSPRTDSDVVVAEAEVLEMICNWLKQYAPHRFEFSAHEIKTLTPGYHHVFKRNDFADCPLRLAALLVQEDLVLMREEDITTGGVKEFQRASEELQRVDHPTGKRHVLVSGVSCFSTNVVKRYMLPMSGIHHPAVPGFQSHLQLAMNRFMTQLTCKGYYRHNYMFQDFDSVLLLDHPWAQHVCQAELGQRTHHQTADRSARFRAAETEGFFKDARTKTGVRRNLRLRCEYQTLRRLPCNSNFIIFTIKNYVDPLKCLESEPSAALALSAVIRVRPKGISYYQSMGLEDAQRALLGYLDDVVIAGKLQPWRGIVPEPWERSVELDGTFAPDAEKQARAALKVRRRRKFWSMSMSLGATVITVGIVSWMMRYRRSMRKLG